MLRKFLEKERTFTLEGSLRIARSHHEAVDRHRKGIVSNARAVQVNVVVEASLYN